MSEFLKGKVGINCPVCGAKLQVTLSDIQQGRTGTCAHGHKVRLSEQGNGIRQADKAINDFKKSIEQLNRKMRRR